ADDAALWRAGTPAPLSLEQPPRRWRGARRPPRGSGPAGRRWARPGGGRPGGLGVGGGGARAPRGAAAAPGGARGRRTPAERGGALQLRGALRRLLSGRSRAAPGTWLAGGRRVVGGWVGVHPGATAAGGALRSPGTGAMGSPGSPRSPGLQAGA